MQLEIKVPSMGESISEALVGQILKPSGSTVAMDDELLELETDKVNQVIFAPKAGTVSWQVSSGQTVAIGQLLGYIDVAAATPPATPPQAAIAPPPQAAVTEPPPAERPPVTAKPPPPPAPAQGGLRQQQSDFVTALRRPAATAAALQVAAPPVPAAISGSAAPRETRQRLPRIRQVIAQRLVAAQQQSAMLTTFNEVDMTQVMAQRKQHKDAFQEKYGVKLGMMSFFVKAVVAALQYYPQLNSYIDGDELVQRHYYDIGIAVGTPRGLVVPVLRACDSLSFAQIEQAIVDFAVRARGGKLAVEELQGGGFTITNGGVYGSLLSTPILNAPQCGILGMHKIQERPVALDGAVVIRPMMYLALSYDHRIIDGKEAVTFLVHIKETLEDLTKILLEL